MKIIYLSGLYVNCSNFFMGLEISGDRFSKTFSVIIRGTFGSIIKKFGA